MMLCYHLLMMLLFLVIQARLIAQDYGTLVITVAVVIYRIWLNRTADNKLMVFTVAVTFIACLVVCVARLFERLGGRSLGCLVRVLPLLLSILLLPLSLVVGPVLSLMSRDGFAWQLVVGEVVEHITIHRP